MFGMDSVRMLVLASGSKGNCTYVGTPHANVLVDCGIAPRRIYRELRSQGIDPASLDAVFISHLHGDHVSGLPSLLRRQRLRVYVHSRAADGLQGIAGWVEHSGADLAAFNGDGGFHHRDLDVLPVSLSHDSDPTVGFKLFCNGSRIGILTDSGETTALHTAVYGDCQALLLEANHCPDLLRHGPYPETLKRRIRGAHGHLSNDQAVQFATGLASLPRHLLLGHLSEQNNHHDAVSAAFTRIETGAIPHAVLEQHRAGQLIEVKP
jgi:phosphoribosyl 1,2-cyclic phosphodiesterase